MLSPIRKTQLFTLFFLGVLVFSGTIVLSNNSVSAISSNTSITTDKLTPNESFALESNPTPNGKMQPVTLKIITRHSTTIQLYMETAFLASQQATDNNIVDIQWTQPGAEYWPTVIPTYNPDIAWGGGPSLFDTIDMLGYLKPMNSTYMDSVMSRIPDDMAGSPMKRFDENMDVIWAAAAISSFGFTINKPWLDDKGLPYPTHWENLTSFEFGGLLPAPTVAMGNSPGTTSNTKIYEIILQRFGWEKGWETLSRMAANGRIYSGSVETQNAVEVGEVGVSMSIDFYGYTTALRNPGTEYIIPQNGSIINGDPIALCTTGTSIANASESFIDWVLSPEGQQIWLHEDINRMPILEDAFLLDKLNPINPSLGARDDLYAFYNTTLQNLSIEFDDPLSLSYEYSLMFYFESVITDAHEKLVDCWGAILDALSAGWITETEAEDFAGMMAAPVSWNDGANTFNESYAISINGQMGSSSSFRSNMQSTWTDAANDQYDYVRSLIPTGPGAPPPPIPGFPAISLVIGVAAALGIGLYVRRRRE
ncbi:MAG: ABC transporter substrate-binding protein [Promethearchaeota archaeon]